MKLVAGDAARHSDAILSIFNEAIANTTALYDYRQRTAADMSIWFADKAANRYPVIVAENDAGELMGFATFGPWRVRPAYKYTVEHSVYVDTRFRGRKVGRMLLEAIVAAAERAQYHVLVGGIDTANAVSIKLHENLGFTHCGTVQQSGFKFGRWLDVAFYQRILATPAAPVDG
jgi:L-amino acid N-acyltransferase YncA